jgi:transcriptional regulator of acetoin/glycerol metabolism
LQPGAHGGLAAVQSLGQAQMPVELTNPWVAVRPLGDRLGQARALRRVHEAFHAGRNVAGELRGVVAQSWVRSGRAGIDPIRHLAPIVMDDRELQDRWSHHPLFPVVPVLRDLLSGATSESAHMLVISDARGVLV